MQTIQEINVDKYNWKINILHCNCFVKVIPSHPLSSYEVDFLLETLGSKSTYVIGSGQNIGVLVDQSNYYINSIEHTSTQTEV